MSDPARTSRTSSVDDAALLSAVAAGDREALARLYDLHAARMLGVAHRVLGNRRDAEDLIHDVFLEAWRKAGTFDSTRGSVRTWLLVKVRSRAIDRLRSLAAARRAGMADPPEDYEAIDAEADATLVRDADRARVEAALRTLPEPQRAVVEMSYLEGYTCAEIAERSGVALGTVKSRLARAMGALRAELVEGSEETP